MPSCVLGFHGPIFICRGVSFSVIFPVAVVVHLPDLSCPGNQQVI